MWKNNENGKYVLSLLIIYEIYITYFNIISSLSEKYHNIQQHNFISLVSGNIAIKSHKSYKNGCLDELWYVGLSRVRLRK